MPPISDIRRQVDILDRQIIELLGRRAALVRQVVTVRDEEGTDPEREAQVLSNWLEEGFDHDLDENGLEKVCKAVMDMSQKAVEI
jgi:prephenate dehydrogenase